MLFTGNPRLLQGSLFGIIAFALFLQGCSSPMNKTTAHIDEDTSPYGEWFLLNPQDMQENLITGGLIVCRKAIREKGETICGDNSYLMVVLERNFGYGCTDYVSTGSIEFNESDQHWYLVSNAEASGDSGKMKIQREGKQLYVVQEGGKNLVFERSNRKAMEEKSRLACELSLGSSGL